MIDEAEKKRKAALEKSRAEAKRQAAESAKGLKERGDAWAKRVKADQKAHAAERAKASEQVKKEREAGDRAIEKAKAARDAAGQAHAQKQAELEAVRTKVAADTWSAVKRAQEPKVTYPLPTAAEARQASLAYEERLRASSRRVS